MGSQERRDRERQELKDKILAAARELFAELGFEAVTMRQIAERIEYSPTAIYLHFADKQALFQELVRVDFMALSKDLGALARVKDPVVRLRRLGLDYVRFGLSYPHHYRLMFMTKAPVPPSAEAVKVKGDPAQDAYALLRLTVAEAHRAGRFRKELKDPEQIAQLVWAGVHGVVSLYITKCDDGWIEWCPVGRSAELMVETMLRGLLREGKGK